SDSGFVAAAAISAHEQPARLHPPAVPPARPATGPVIAAPDNGPLAARASPTAKVARHYARRCADPPPTPPCQPRRSRPTCPASDGCPRLRRLRQAPAPAPRPPATEKRARTHRSMPATPASRQLAEACHHRPATFVAPATTPAHLSWRPPA